MPFPSLHLDGHQRSQATRKQQTVVQLSLSSSAAIALPSPVSKSHSISRRMRSVRPPSNSQVDRSSLSHTLPISRSSAARLFTVQRVQASLSSSAVGPSPAVAPFVSSVLLTHPLGPSTSAARASSDAVSSHFSDMSPETAPRERQNFSAGDTRERTPPRLFALFVVGSHPLESFPSVPSG